MVQWNSLLMFYLASFTASLVLRLLLSFFQWSHLRRHGKEVPEAFRGVVDVGTLAKSARYNEETMRFGVLESLVDDAITLTVLLSGLLPWLLGVLPGGQDGFVFTGLLFFGCIALTSGLIGIPFDLYRTFVLERRHGFGTITLRLWLTDLLKGMTLSALLLGLLLTAFLALLYVAPYSWWIWTWLTFVAFQWLLLWLYPVLIAPLFNRFEPVRDEGLREAVIALLARAGLRTEGVYQVDAIKRSRHTNAYFTGIGRTKRIVLFDTLIASHHTKEIVAILAHEIGHWQGRHLLKQLLIMAAGSLFLLWFAAQLITWPLLYETFGFQQPVPFVGLLLVLVLLEPFSIIVNPALATLRRRFERQADDAVRSLTGGTEPLVAALKRLAKDNLINLHPHPSYVCFYDSHPPLVERISRLERGERQDGGSMPVGSGTCKGP